jgi:hypothetical protein
MFYAYGWTSTTVIQYVLEQLEAYQDPFANKYTTCKGTSNSNILGTTHLQCTCSVLWQRPWSFHGQDRMVERKSNCWLLQTVPRHKQCGHRNRHEPNRISWLLVTRTPQERHTWAWCWRFVSHSVHWWWFSWLRFFVKRCSSHLPGIHTFQVSVKANRLAE